MRASTEPYCFIMLAPRPRRGGTMRPENSSKLWLKTRCERSRESTAWSSVTPLSPDAIADCEIPLAAASFLKSASHASKLPVPQDAANAEAAGIISTAPTARVLRREREVIGTLSSEMVLNEERAPAAGNLCGNRGQNKAQGSRWFRARLKHHKFEQQSCLKNQATIVIARSQRVPPSAGPMINSATKAIQTCVVALDCFAEPVIGHAFARPVGSQ